MMTDISERTKVINLLDATRTAARTAQAKEGAQGATTIQPRAGLAVVDLLGYESCMFALLGAGMGSSVLSVKHGDDEANLEDAEDYCLIHDNEAEATDKVQRLGYIGARRYVQVVSTTSPTTAVAVLQRPSACPKSKDSTYAS